MSVVSCSFCGRGTSDGVTLVEGPAVYICNECVKLSAEILLERKKMNLLAFLPEKYQSAVSLFADAVPLVKCLLVGHDPLPLVDGTKRKPAEGVKQVRLCKRCYLAYWEEPS